MSKEKVPLKDLEVTFNSDPGFVYNNIGYSASYSFIWTSLPLNKLPEFTDQIGTNGLRETIPEKAYALSVIFMGTKATSGSVSDLMYIILHDATGIAPEIDHRVGYRWFNYVKTDLSAGVYVKINEDETLGYIVSINGVEYREGKRGDEILPIDLNVLKDVEGGYLCMGAESTGADEYANFTWNTINQAPAGNVFNNDEQTDCSRLLFV